MADTNDSMRVLPHENALMIRPNAGDPMLRFFAVRTLSVSDRSRLILILVEDRIMIRSGWSDPPMKFQNTCLNADQLTKDQLSSNKVS